MMQDIKILVSVRSELWPRHQEDAIPYHALCIGKCLQLSDFTGWVESCMSDTEQLLQEPKDMDAQQQANSAQQSIFYVHVCL